jgi:hypothetical protein
VISAVEFDSDGSYLATGDKGGRVVLFEKVPTQPVSCSSAGGQPTTAEVQQMMCTASAAVQAAELGAAVPMGQPRLCRGPGAGGAQLCCAVQRHKTSGQQ